MKFDVITILWRNLFNGTSVVSLSIQAVKNGTIFVKNVSPFVHGFLLELP